MIRQPRTSQPQGAVGIDWGNPITRGLFFAETPSGQRRPKLTKPVPGGIAFLSDGTSASHLITSIPSKTLNNFTLFLVGAGSTINSAATGFALSGPSDVGTNSQASLLFEAFSNTGRWGFDSNTIGTDRTFNLNDQNEHVAIVVRVGTSVKLYLGGVLSGTAAVNASSINVNAVKLFCKGTGNIDTAPNGSYIKTYGALSRDLSDAEIKSLSDNPWQIFQPTNRAIWVPVAAAGGSPYTLTADAANVPIAGTDTGLAFNRTLVAEAAALAINGTATGLAFNRRLIADTANLALTGNAATLTYTPIGGPTYTLTADTANTAITGADAGLAFNRNLIADTANLPISGTDAGLARGYTLAADNGALGISGSDAALIAVRKLVADAYALAIAGADATLTYTPLTLPTIGRPASDTSNTGWTASTGSDLYAMLDEVTPSDADYISASSVGAVCKMALNTTAYPGSASQVLKYRASSSTGNSVIVRLKEGVTTIRAETQLLTSVDTEYSITLTSGEIAAITSGALSVELESA